MADETIKTKDYNVYRDGPTITIHQSTEDYAVGVHRKYETEHAAVCAMGRIRADNNFAQTLYNSFHREMLGQQRRKRKKEGESTVRMEHVVGAALLDLMPKDVQEDDKKSAAHLKALVKKAAKLAEKGKRPYSHDIRQLLKKHNQ